MTGCRMGLPRPVVARPGMIPCSHHGVRAMTTSRITAIVRPEDDMYVALCPELDIASQGTSIEQATANLKEAPNPCAIRAIRG